VVVSADLEIKGLIMAKDLVIQIENLTKVYQMGQIQVHALRGVSFSVKTGEVLAIMGPSGSGKSTLMNMIGCLDIPSAGDYFLEGELVSTLNEEQLALVRNRKIGFVFQKFNLLPRATALANVELPLRYAGLNGSRKGKAQAALEAVGLGDRIYHQPNELSGGQQQRVAIARALVNQPAIILADEPTGNLDTKSGDEIMNLLLDLNQTQGTTLLIVTHDPEVATVAERVIYLRDGLIENQEVRA
jgi:putative ABC transport system ATP-binding protein